MKTAALLLMSANKQFKQARQISIDILLELYNQLKYKKLLKIIQIEPIETPQPADNNSDIFYHCNFEC